MRTAKSSEQTPIRIFLANRPRMVRQMLRRAIQRIPDLTVVGEATRIQSILDAPRAMTFDWLVVSLTDQGKIPKPILSFSRAHPSIKVLGMSLDGNELELKDISGDSSRHLSDVSLNTLISLFQNKYREDIAH